MVLRRDTAPRAFLLGVAMLVLVNRAGAEEYIDDDGNLAGNPPIVGLPALEPTLGNGATLQFYGQINKGFLNFDDGQVAKTYDFLDNANSGTRVGLNYGQSFGDWDYLGNIELQYAPFSSANTNILNPTPSGSQRDFTNANIRRIDNRFFNPEVGFIHFGQGSMASDGAAGTDLSDTTVISSSGVADMAAAQLFRFADGALSTVQVRNAFANYSGLGRLVRLRYDTPVMSGFQLRTSYGRNLLSDNAAVREQDQYDLALVYTGAFDDVQISAMTAYGWRGDTVSIFSGSASALHVPSGLNLTLAAGTQDNGALVSSYGYIKAGWRGDLVAWGQTAVSVEAYSGSDIAGAGTDSTSSAFAIVQDIARYNTELWMILRNYNLNSTTADFLPAQALFAGVRLRF